MDEKINCNENDMIDFWSVDFGKNRLTAQEDGRKLAKSMYKSWVRAGLGFQDILDDYLAHPGYCPENKKTGKDWLELLNKDKKSEFPPYCLIISTIKYFKSKGPELCLGNVVDEERNRLRISDYRVVFLRLPPEEKDQMRNVKNFISKLFKEALFVEIMKNDTLIKIGFKNWYGKKRALEYAHERQLVWPNTQSRLTFQDPEKQNMGYNSMGTCGILMQEGIANELLFLNFKLVTGNMRLNMELTSNFPGLDDYRLDTEKNQLVLVFKERKDAFKAFQKTKYFTLCECKCTVIFNRKKGPPKLNGNLRNNMQSGSKHSRKQEFRHERDREGGEFGSEKRLKRGGHNERSNNSPRRRRSRSPKPPRRSRSPRRSPWVPYRSSPNDGKAASRNNNKY